MRSLFPVFLLGAALAAAWQAPVAEARPEFARREAKACGYCHINPMGGGARNRNGLLYARNEFSFPAKAGNLADFQNDRDRAAMARARKMIDIDHVREASSQLRRLAKSLKGPPRQLVEEELHQLDVKGTEILGQARRMLRGSDREEGVELLVVLTVEYRDLDVASEAKSDLKELKRDKEMRPVVKKEEREAKARALYLDGMKQKVDGKPDLAEKAFRKVLKSYPGCRVVKLCKRELGMPVPEDNE